MREAGRRRLRSAVRHAARAVPHYRELFARLDLRPDDIRTVEDLSRLPILTRRDLQRDHATLQSEEHPPDRCLPIFSGGSTGSPSAIRHNPAALFQNAAHGERERSIVARLVGRRSGWREAVIVSPLSSAQKIQGFMRDRLALPPGVEIRRAYLSILDPPEQNLRRLEKFRPDVVHGYGSYVARLFAHLEETGASFHRPRVVTYSSDGLPDSARRRITRMFGIPVLGTYQSAEALKIGFECEAGGLHVNVDLYPVRLVDREGRTVPEWESGDVVLSNLVNRGTVLLNYRVGDRAAFRPGPCACGRTLPRLAGIQGRDDDWVFRRDGSLVHSQAVRSLFGDESEVWQFQVVQETPDRFRVAVVDAPGTDHDRLESRLVEKFVRRLGPGTEIDLSFVPAIEPPSRGKLRAFIGLCPEAGRE